MEQGKMLKMHYSWI